ncbi:MAG: PEGA domain-containing protein [Proteobacteria bacterium]|nr:PEGA domain-containing protein [Pseudomonadota bacterium]MCP4920822.1 PEGA domain-containing protein [Pseudomonadota bacterium]
MWLVLASLILGCAHKVSVTSDPPGAAVFFRGQKRGVTPVEFTTVWTPHVGNGARRYRLRVQLPGHRPVVTSIGPDMRVWRYAVQPLRGGIAGCLLPPFDWAGGACIHPRSSRHMVMVVDHGPAGTWTPDDAQRK